MPLGNYVILEEGVPERVHFISHVLDKRDITDPKTLQPVTRNVALFTVDRLNGQPVNAMLSVMAEKLYAKFEAYLPGQVYRNYDFIITKRGTGFRTTFTVEIVPLAGK